MKTKIILLIIMLFTANMAVSNPDTSRKSYIIVKSNFMAITLLTELNVYVEAISRAKKGFEFGASFHSPENFILMSYTSFGFSRSRTSGAPYGLGSVWTPMYIAGHKGFSFTFNYKIYRANLEKFYGPQIVFAYRELRNGYYTNHDEEGPGYQSGYYWYKANHYSKKIGILANFGRAAGIAKKLPIEMGGAIGLNFCFDNLHLLEWGAHIQNADPNFVNYDKMERTKHTDGFYVTPALRLYFKVGLSLNK